MQISPSRIYKRAEIKHLFACCPLCHNKDCTFWSHIFNNEMNFGQEGIDCPACNLSLVFTFKVDLLGEIIDEYMFTSFMIANVEFKTDKDKIAVYNNCIFVRRIPSLDIAKYDRLLLVS